MLLWPASQVYRRVGVAVGGMPAATSEHPVGQLQLAVNGPAFRAFTGLKATRYLLVGNVISGLDSDEWSRVFVPRRHDAAPRSSDGLKFTGCWLQKIHSKECCNHQDHQAHKAVIAKD